MSRHSTNPWIVLVLICFAQFMVVLDATVVNVALPVDPDDPRLQRGEPAVGRQRVHARLRRFPAARRARRRPPRAEAALPLRLDRLHRRPRSSNGLATTSGMLIGFRALQGLGAAFISPAALVDHLHDVRRGQGALPGARRLGRDRDRRPRSRPRARRRAHAGFLLAVDLLRQRAGRHRRLLRRAAAGAGVEGRARRTGASTSPARSRSPAG